MCKNNEFSVFKQPVYKKNPVPTGTWTITRAHQEITGERLKWQTDKIHECKTPKERKRLKQAYLPYVTFAGTFSYRNDASIIKRSGYIVLDIDHLSDQGCNLQEVKQAILGLFTPALMYISVSGDGLKVVCRIDTTGDHIAYFLALEAYFQQQFSLPLDGSGKDVPRASFLCYDPGVFMSDSPTMFGTDFLKEYGKTEKEDVAVQQETITTSLTNVTKRTWTSKTPLELTPEEIYRRAKIWINKHETFTEGNRNRYVSKLAYACRRFLLSEDQTLMFVGEFQQKGFPIKSIIRSVYKKTDFRYAPLIKTPQS